MNQTDENEFDPASRELLYGEFVALLARHDEAIRRFVRFLLPTRDGVDDVMQETALECWRKFSDFQPQGYEDLAEADFADRDFADEFVRWACVIARYKALSWQRDRARDRLVFRESVIKSLSQSALDSIDRREEERLAVKHCLGKLPTDQRRLVLSVHTPGESVARIAKETGQKSRRLYSKVNVLRSLLLDCVQRQLVGEASRG